MFGISWERKPRHGRIFSRPGRYLTHRNNFWQISKTRLPRPLTSPAASLAIRKHCNMHPHPWTSCLGLDSICRRATWHSIRAISRVQQQHPDSRIGRGYRTQPGINEAEPIASKGDKSFQGKIVSPAGIVHKGPQPSQSKTRFSAADNNCTSAEKRQSATAHEEEKTALMVVGLAGGLAPLWLSSR